MRLVLLFWLIYLSHRVILIQTPPPDTFFALNWRGVSRHTDHLFTVSATMPITILVNTGLSGRSWIPEDFLHWYQRIWWGLPLAPQYDFLIALCNQYFFVSVCFTFILLLISQRITCSTFYYFCLSFIVTISLSLWEDSGILYANWAVWMPATLLTPLHLAAMTRYGIGNSKVSARLLEAVVVAHFRWLLLAQIQLLEILIWFGV